MNEQLDTVDEVYNGDGYCVRCKDKREFVGLVVVMNGRRFAKGECPVCGTKITRILGNAEAVN